MLNNYSFLLGICVGILIVLIGSAVVLKLWK